MTSVHTRDRLEVEWQFEARDLRWVERWLAAYPADAATLAAGGEVCQDDEYLDTESWVIYRAGYALRIRRVEGQPIVGILKALSRPDDGPASRREIEQPLGCDASVTKGEGAVVDRVRMLIRDKPLRHLFRVQTRRRSLSVCSQGEEVAELTLDEAVIRRERFGDVRLQRVEVEEMREGGLDAIRPFVDAMVTACGLTPARTSKFEAGLQAHGLVPTTTPYLGPTATSPDDTATAYALAKLRFYFGEFLRHEPGSRLGDDPEAVHRMRVATRRLRAAISTFNEALPQEFQLLLGELKWFGGVLGEVRDLDVQIEAIHGVAEGDGWDVAHAKRALIARLETQRRGARSRLIDALNSSRFGALVNDTSLALSQDGTGPDQPRDVVREFAPPRIRHRYRKFREGAKDLTADSPAADFHEVRIRGKRLRYTLDLFAELYRRPAEKLIEEVVGVQNLLGEHQDLNVLNERLYAIARRYGAALEPPSLVLLGALIERNRARAERIREAWKDEPEDVHKRWRRLRDELDAQEAVHGDETSNSEGTAHASSDRAS